MTGLARDRLRVILMTSGFPTTDKPGNGIFNLRAAKALKNLVDLTVIHLRAWKPGRRRIEATKLEGIPVYTVTAPQIPCYKWLNGPLYEYFGWSQVRSLFNDCDLIHSVGADFAGVMASSWARRVPVHHITQVVGSDINSVIPRQRGSRASKGWEEQLHGVACNSRALAQAFVTLHPAVPNVKVIYRGVDLDRCRPTGPAIGPLVHRPPVRFLFLGGFPAYRDSPHRTNTKGGQTLLAAWREAEEDLIASDASLLIGGPDSNAKIVNGWRAELVDPSRVHLAGHLHPDQIPPHIRSSDVVLIPSLAEGLPNVAVEAGACGRPVFGSNVGGIPEVIVDGETGLLLPAGEVKAWKNALIAYARKSFELKAMGDRARCRMEALFDSRTYGEQMMNLYRVALREPLSGGDATHVWNTGLRRVERDRLSAVLKMNRHRGPDDWWMTFFGIHSRACHEAVHSSSRQTLPKSIG